jgi:hypothetical protein
VRQLPQREAANRGLISRPGLATPGPNAEAWEKVIAKLRTGSMPPPGRPRPDNATYHAAAARLERQVDRA